LCDAEAVTRGWGAARDVTLTCGDAGALTGEAELCSACLRAKNRRVTLTTSSAALAMKRMVVAVMLTKNKNVAINYSFAKKRLSTRARAKAGADMVPACDVAGMTA